MQNKIAAKVPGLALVVVIDGKVALLKTYGNKRIGGKREIEHDTVFRIASVSKTFASAAIAVLVQKNIIAWDSMLLPYLQGVEFKNKEYAQQLRIDHLLSHTSGLIPHTYTNLLNQNVNYQEIKKLIHKVDFVCKPGDCYAYQNVVYSLLGDVVDYASVENYETFVQNQLFIPLQMENASFGEKVFTQNSNTATPHVRRRGRWVPVKVKPNYYQAAPAAGVNASINDMSKWLLAQLGASPKVLSEAALDTMHTKRIKTTKNQAHYGQWENLDNAHYGFGWRVFDYGGKSGFVHHGGWVQGFRTEMVLNKELGLGMVLLVNAERAYTNKAVPGFLDLLIEHGLLKSEAIQ